MRPVGVDDERRSGEERREMRIPAWLPSLAMSFIIQLVGAVAIIVSMRSDVGNVRTEIAELKGQVTTLQSLVQVTTEQRGKIAAIEDRLKKVEDAVDTQNKAYNFHFTEELAYLKAKLGIPVQKKGD